MVAAGPANGVELLLFLCYGDTGEAQSAPKS